MKIDFSLIGHTSRRAMDDAKSAESWGFDGAWATESITDSFLQSMAITLATDQIEIGTAIAVAFSRNPMTTAYCAWDLASASNGRFTLGLGSQVEAHITRRFSMPWGNPVLRMGDYLNATKAIFESWRTGSKLNYQGTYYKHNLMTPVFTPPHHDHEIKIVIAAVGEQMTTLAGQMCDGVILHGMTHPTFIDSVTMPALLNGLKTSKNSRETFTISCPLFFVMGDSESEIILQREEARRQLSFYASTPAYKGVLDALGYGDIQPILQNLSRQGDWNQMAKVFEDDLLDSLIIQGKPEEIPFLVGKRFGNRLDRVSSYFGWPLNDADRLKDIVKAFHSLK